MNSIKNIFTILAVSLFATTSWAQADDPCAAGPITVGTSCNFSPFTNAGATASAGVPAPGCANYAGGDVWFTATVPASGHLIVDGNTGVMTDGGMAFYTGTCGSLTLVECNDDSSPNGLMPMIDRTGMTPGATVWIRVWEYGNNNNGSFSLCAYDGNPGGGGGGAPANDDPCAATALTVGAACSFSTFTNASATATAGVPAPGCASYSGGDVWFTAVVPPSGHLIVDCNTGVMTDGGMAFYTGTCGSLTLVECDDDGSVNGLMPMIDRTGMTPGTTVWVRVWEYGNNNNGTFDICAYDGNPGAGPPGDDPCSASGLVVGSTCSFSTFSNAAATATAGVPAPGCASYSGGDVWFTAVVPTSGHLIIDCNTGVITDGGMAIYTGTCGALTLVECDDDDSANGLMPMINRTGLTPGATVWIRFWEFGNDNNGTFDLCVYDGTPPTTGGPGIVPTACATQTFNITANTNFYDDGGAGGLPCTDPDPNNFCNCNCETTTTICAPAGQAIVVDFTVFAMFNTNSAFDWMKIYDGPNTGSPVLFNNDLGGPDNAPNGGTGSGYGDCGDDAPPVGFCSSGQCLTFEFHASGVVNRAGWEAAVQLATPTCVILLGNSLTSFDAQKVEDKVEVTWETTSEINSDYFSIERSQDGIVWEVIATIPGAGTSSSPISYKEYDNTPLSGVSYYRLKETDLSGKSAYSATKAVSFQELDFTSVLVFPNPATNQVTIKGKGDELERCTIYNSIGQDVTNNTILEKKQNNSLVLNISGLAAGMYTIKTKTASTKLRKH